MNRKYLEALEARLAEDSSRENTEKPGKPDPDGAVQTESEDFQARQNRTRKTRKTVPTISGEAKDSTRKTSKTPDADQLGLVASWSGEFGYVSLHDPNTGEWHDFQTKDAPGWSLWEARKRKELYKGGNGKAYRLTSSQMGEIWEAERSTIEEGIVEEYPVEAEEA
jgi:hypothetical protein